MHCFSEGLGREGPRREILQRQSFKGLLEQARSVPGQLQRARRGGKEGLRGGPAGGRGAAGPRSSGPLGWLGKAWYGCTGWGVDGKKAEEGTAEVRQERRGPGSQRLRSQTTEFGFYATDSGESVKV